DEIWSIWSVRRAQQALENHKSEQSTAILLDAERMLPGNRRIQSALGATYVRQHEYHKALDAYQSWGMAGANAGDYRAAAGAALALHNDSLADQFLQEGIQHWPRDPELLRMAAKQEIAHAKYDDAKRDLRLALTATRESAGSKTQENDTGGAESFAQTARAGQKESATTLNPESKSSPATACRTTAGSNATGDAQPRPMSYARGGRARLVNAAYVYNDGPQQRDRNAGSADHPQQAQQPQQAQDRKTDST